jgi:hypothetical protein
MAFITEGLTNSGLGNGITPHYSFAYDEQLNSATHPGGPEPSRTNALIAQCENDYNLMANWFGGIAPPFPLPLQVQVANAGGGASWGPPITLDPGAGDANFMRSLMVSEVTEMLMRAQGKGWFAPDGSNEQSCGEGLSHFLAQQFQIVSGIGLNTAFAGNGNIWLNSALTPVVNGKDYGARSDYVNTTLEYDHGNDPGSGCAVLFIYYLFTQLGFPINNIIAAAPGIANASKCLRGVFANLTGDSSDPFPFFKQLLNAAFPPSVPAAIPGPNPDNPWPLGPSGTPWIQATITTTDPIRDNPNTHLPVVIDFEVVGFGFTPAGKVGGRFGTIVADIWGGFSWSARISPRPTLLGFRPRVGEQFSVTDVLTGTTVSAAIGSVEG